MKKQRIYLSPPHMCGIEEGLVREAFLSNFIAPLGPMVDAFEREFSEYTGIPHCVALSSGTAAMHLALKNLLQHGAERAMRSAGSERPLVLASSLTFIGSVSPATFEDCDITFIDCDRETWNMDPVLLAEELERCERNDRLPLAVIPTDLYGQCCDLPRIARICEQYDVPVICDSAEAVGARYWENAERLKGENAETLKAEKLKAEKLKWEATAGVDTSHPPPDTRHAGYGAWAAVYSFNGNKIITTSGGGMLASHDRRLIDHARKLATQAREPFPHYEHEEIGHNYRMGNVVAAIGRGQLQVIAERVRRKREICEMYRDLLGERPGIEFMPEADHGRSNRWLTVVLIDSDAFGVTPKDIRLELEEHNIEARPVWKPMHLQPVFAKPKQPGPAYRVVGGKVSEDLFARGLCLPSGTALTDSDIEEIATIVLGKKLKN